MQARVQYSIDQCRQLLTADTESQAEPSCRENLSNPNSIPIGRRSDPCGVAAKHGLKSRRFSPPEDARPPSRTCTPFTNAKPKAEYLSGSGSLRHPLQRSRRSRRPRSQRLRRQWREGSSSPPRLPGTRRQRRSLATTSIFNGFLRDGFHSVVKQFCTPTSPWNLPREKHSQTAPIWLKR